MKKILSKTLICANILLMSGNRTYSSAMNASAFKPLTQTRILSMKIPATNPSHKPVTMVIEKGINLDDVSLLNHSDNGGIANHHDNSPFGLLHPIDQMALSLRTQGGQVLNESALRSRLAGLSQNYWKYIMGKMECVKQISKDADDCYKKLREMICTEIGADEKFFVKMCHEGYEVILNNIPNTKDPGKKAECLNYVNYSKDPGPLFQFIRCYTLIGSQEKKIPESEGVPYALMLKNGSFGIVIPYVSTTEKRTKGMFFYPYAVLDQMIADIVEKEYNQKIQSKDDILQYNMKRYGFTSIRKMLNSYNLLDQNKIMEEKRKVLWPWLYTSDDFIKL